MMGHKIEFGPVYPTQYPERFRTFEQDRHFKGVWQMEAKVGRKFIRPKYYFSRYPTDAQLDAAKSFLVGVVDDLETGIQPAIPDVWEQKWLDDGLEKVRGDLF